MNSDREKYIICMASPADRGKTETANEVIKALCAKKTLKSLFVFDIDNNQVQQINTMDVKADHVAFLDFPNIKIGVVTVGDPNSTQEYQLDRVARWDIKDQGQSVVTYRDINAPDMIICTARTIDSKAEYYKAPEEIVKCIANTSNYNYHLIWMSQMYTDWCDMRMSIFRNDIPKLRRSSCNSVVDVVESIFNVTL